MYKSFDGNKPTNQATHSPINNYYSATNKDTPTTRKDKYSQMYGNLPDTPYDVDTDAYRREKYEKYFTKYSNSASTTPPSYMTGGQTDAFCRANDGTKRNVGDSVAVDCSHLGDDWRVEIPPKSRNLLENAEYEDLQFRSEEEMSLLGDTQLAVSVASIELTCQAASSSVTGAIWSPFKLSDLMCRRLTDPRTCCDSLVPHIIDIEKRLLDLGDFVDFLDATSAINLPRCVQSTFALMNHPTIDFALFSASGDTVTEQLLTGISIGNFRLQDSEATNPAIVALDAIVVELGSMTCPPVVEFGDQAPLHLPKYCHLRVDEESLFFGRCVQYGPDWDRNRIIECRQIVPLCRKTDAILWDKVDVKFRPHHHPYAYNYAGAGIRKGKYNDDTHRYSYAESVGGY
ncbi:MAG: hypothetical protein MHM6MM_001067 [Cercozoa sp. M6MM]